MTSISLPPGTAVFWFVGLPASGKTTLARALHAHLGPHLAPGSVRLLDADVERADARGVLYGLGWSPSDRLATVTALAQAAELAPVSLVALVTSTAWERTAAQHLLGERLHLVHVDAPIALCRQRDTLRSTHAYRPDPPPDAPELSWATPVNPDLRLDSTKPAQESIAAVLAFATSVLGLAGSRGQ
jgi:gluconate kinase